MDILVLILLLVGFGCFIVAAIGRWSPKVNLIALGLACWIATVIIPFLVAATK